jgi:hypothetical protein
MTTISEISSPRSQRFVHLGFARSVVGTWLLGRAEVELDRHGRDHRGTRGWWLGRGDGSEAGAPPTSSVVVVRLDVDGDEGGRGEGGGGGGRGGTGGGSRVRCYRAHDLQPNRCRPVDWIEPSSAAPMHDAHSPARSSIDDASSASDRRESVLNSSERGHPQRTILPYISPSGSLISSSRAPSGSRK